MPQQDDRIIYLFRRYADNTCTREELTELAELAAAGKEEQLYELMEERYAQMQPGASADRIDWEMMFHTIVGQRTATPLRDENVLGEGTPLREGESVRSLRPLHLWSQRWIGAAAIAACLLLGLFLYSHFSGDQMTQKDLREAAAGKRVDTISNKAVLVLGNGSKIILNETGADKLLAESKIGATSSAGKLSYGHDQADGRNQKNGRNQEGIATTYNTLSVPRGVRYSVELPDGTQVMLNAESSLTYPTRFDGVTRSVKLTGEGYFRVTKDAAHPFIVNAGSSNVKVLGTTFNINVYRPIMHTTLEEGKVLVKTSVDSVPLMPGEQARYASSGKVTKREVDVDTYTGWTRNEVIFDENTSLADAMEVLGRAYNYEIDFSDPELKNIKIAANIDKSEYLGTILDYIRKITDISFDIDQLKRRVTIKKEK